MLLTDVLLKLGSRQHAAALRAGQLKVHACRERGTRRRCQGQGRQQRRRWAHRSALDLAATQHVFSVEEDGLALLQPASPSDGRVAAVQTQLDCKNVMAKGGPNEQRSWTTIKEGIGLTAEASRSSSAAPQGNTQNPRCGVMCTSLYRALELDQSIYLVV